MFLESITSKNAPAAIGPYSPGVKLGDFVYLSGQIALDPNTGELVSADPGEQTRQVMENIKALLAEKGLATHHIVKTTVYLADLQDFAVFNEIYGSYFTEPYPARSTIQVAGLPKNAKVEIECLVLDTLAYEQDSCEGCQSTCDSCPHE